MANYNKVFLIGNLTRDPQLRYTPNQMAVCDIGLAVNRRSRSSSGEQRDETCFVDITAWGKQAETLSKYVTKGRQLFIEGRLTYDQWEGQDGQKRSKLKVTLENFQFLDSAGAGGGSGGGGGGGRGQGRAGQQSSGGGGHDEGYNQDLEDDTIPF
ncbi:MAG: single-stranded DNA-binding protein [Planctomycetes bacterium]|nr:single-stranded DNA-binding protein [Planctomycetota bacterium]